MKSYSEYQTRVSSDCSCWGNDATDDSAMRSAESFASAIEREFPGINVSVVSGESETEGPNEDVCREIKDWSDDNWLRHA